MPDYHVVRTGDGGYWISDSYAMTTAVGAANAVGEGLGSAIGAGINWLVEAGEAAARRRRLQEQDEFIQELGDALEAEDWSRAHLAATDVVRRYPAELFGYDAQATSAAALGRSDEVLAIADTVAQLGIGDESYVAQLRCIGYLGQQQMPALLSASQTLVDNPSREQRTFGLAMRARALLWLGDLTQALADADSAVGMTPSAETYALRGDVRWARGELDGALAAYTFALRLGPEIHLLSKRAAVFEALGRTHDAAEDRRIVDELAPDASGPADAPSRHAITVRRVRQQRGGGARYTLILDGNEVGSLAGGESIRLDVDPSVHEVQVQFGPIRSRPAIVDTTKDADVELECGEAPTWMPGVGSILVREPGKGGKDFWH